MNVVESRQQREQRSISAREAPWRFVRDPTKLLLRSLRFCCALYALAAIKALPLRRYDLWTAQPRRFRCALGALSAFPLLLCYSHDDWTTLCLVYASMPALKTFQSSTPRLFQNTTPPKARRAKYIHRPSRNRRRGMPTPAPQTSAPSAFTPAPSRWLDVVTTSSVHWETICTKEIGICPWNRNEQNILNQSPLNDKWTHPI